MILLGCEAQSPQKNQSRMPSSELGGGGSLTAERTREIIKNFKPDPNNPHGFRPDFSGKAPYQFVKRNKRACQKDYIRKDGSYGPAAQSIIDRFKYMAGTEKIKKGEPDPKHFKRLFLLQSRQIAKTCPKYNNMNLDMRFHFYMWVFTSIAYIESDCGVHAKNLKDVNGQSICDYQLPNNEEGRSPKWRGPGCDIRNDGRAKEYEFSKGKLVKTTKYEMANQDTCSACAVEILGKTLCGFHSDGKGKRCTGFSTESLFGSHMFWNEMKTEDRHIMKLIKAFPGCK